MENAQLATKAKIRPNIANMVKTPGGSFHKDDFIGNSLAGLSLAQVIHIAQECGISTVKYGHLNNGQIRMTLGGILRKLVKLPGVPEGTDYTEAQILCLCMICSARALLYRRLYTAQNQQERGC